MRSAKEAARDADRNLSKPARYVLDKIEAAVEAAVREGYHCASVKEDRSYAAVIGELEALGYTVAWSDDWHFGAGYEISW